MAINNKTLSSVQSKVTGLTTNETDFRTGLDDALIQVSDSEVLLSNVSSSDLVKLSAVTASSAELNILDGITASTSEINKLNGLNTTTGELNLLNGVTATTEEINLLDGITATKTEINKLDGFTGTHVDLNKIAAVTATATELNVLDGFTGTTADLNRTVALDDAGNGTADQVLTSDGTGGYSWATPSSFTFVIEDENGTEVSIDTDEVKVQGEGVAVSWGTGDGTDGNPYLLNIDNSDKGSSQNIFKNIAVDNQDTIIADTNNDTLNVASGTGLSITTDATTDTMTFAVDTSGASIGQFLKYNGTGVEWSVDNDTITTNTDTTYSAGTGLDLSGTTFSIEPDLRDSITHLGLSTTDYITWSTDNFMAVVNGTGRINAYDGGAYVTGDFSVSSGTLFVEDGQVSLADGFTVHTSSGSNTLIIKKDNVSLFKLDSSGNLTVKGNVTAYGSL